MKTISITLPWPPSVNHYYGRSKAGHVYLKEAGREFRKAAAREIQEIGYPRISGPVCVQLVMKPPDRRRRDIDNPRKAAYDAISDRYYKRALVHRGVIPDDSNIRMDGASFTDPDGGPGCITVLISELETDV